MFRYAGRSRLSILIESVLGTRNVLFKPIRTILGYIFHIEINPLLFSNKLLLIHPYNIIIHNNSVVGKNCTIYNNVTIANSDFGNKQGAPTIGDDVIIYPNVVIVGRVTIGNKVIIGAGSIVTRSFGDNVIVAGNPATVISKNNYTGAG